MELLRKEFLTLHEYREYHECQEYREPTYRMPDSRLIIEVWAFLFGLMSLANEDVDWEVDVPSPQTLRFNSTFMLSRRRGSTKPESRLVLPLSHVIRLPLSSQHCLFSLDSQLLSFCSIFRSPKGQSDRNKDGVHSTNGEISEQYLSICLACSHGLYQRERRNLGFEGCWKSWD